MNEITQHVEMCVQKYSLHNIWPYPFIVLCVCQSLWRSWPRKLGEGLRWGWGVCLSTCVWEQVVSCDMCIGCMWRTSCVIMWHVCRLYVRTSYDIMWGVCRLYVRTSYDIMWGVCRLYVRTSCVIMWRVCFRSKLISAVAKVKMSQAVFWRCRCYSLPWCVE